MTHFSLPFQPIRSTLYTPRELFHGFDLRDARSFAATLDFSIYSYFIRCGGANSGDALSTMMEALHDNSITSVLRDKLAKQKCVAIMGGHDLDRDAPAYKNVVLLARALSREGFFLASGGGPGAMEATHLGASLAGAPDKKFPAALRLLSKKPKLPWGLQNIVAADGTVNYDLVKLAFDWFKPAMLVARDLEASPCSIAVPTWNYGHEPTTPFTSNIAKYFQNSIREDGLVRLGKSGVVFTEGRAGTIQEIFQDASLNYYADPSQWSPMVFLGTRRWGSDYPVWALLKKLFKPTLRDKYLLLTDSISDVVTFLKKF